MVNQSINRPKVYNKGLRLIDWFNPPSEKLPRGDDFRVGPNSDRTLRDNTLLVGVSVGRPATAENVDRSAENVIINHAGVHAEKSHHENDVSSTKNRVRNLESVSGNDCSSYLQ